MLMLTLFLGEGGVGGGGVNPLVFNSRETLQGIVGFSI